MYIQDKKKLIGNIVFFLIIIITLVIGYLIFEKYNFNDYIKSEYYINKTKFTRDSKQKYSKLNSYKLYSQEYNDAIFYKKIKVEKNQVYKITCMVKTENVETEKDYSSAGAQISVTDTTEKSKAITGTSDWQKLELLIDSKDRDEIDIGFRLGGYDDNCRGIAWFSDFKIEKRSSRNKFNMEFCIIYLRKYRCTNTEGWN